MLVGAESWALADGFGVCGLVSSFFFYRHLFYMQSLSLLVFF